LRNDVRGDVLGGLPHLVDQLLGDRVDRHHASGPGVLGDREGAVRPRLDDGIADVPEVGHLPEAAEVAARALSAAFYDVAGDGAGGQAIPVLLAPAELVDHRGEGERGVGDPPAEDDLGAHLEGLDDRPGAQIGVGAHHLVDMRGERGAGVHIGELVTGRDELLQARVEVVPLDHPDPYAGEAELFRHLENARPAGARVQAPGVGQDADVSLLDLRQGAADEADEVGGVAELGVLELLPHHDREGDLGEVVHADIVDRPPSEQLDGRVDAVPPEPLSIADPDRFHRRE